MTTIEPDPLVPYSSRAMPYPANHVQKHRNEPETNHKPSYMRHPSFIIIYRIFSYIMDLLRVESLTTKLCLHSSSSKYPGIKDNWTTQKEFLCLDNEHIFGGDQGDSPYIIDEILTTARDLELEVNEDDIKELIMGHEDELMIEELQEILNEEHQETQRNVSPEQEEDERGPMPTSVVKDLFKK
ncbi:hypothetical protein TNCV_1855371 [Trichonephila clavipes]|nr:hypothetical protein TNCV_1855371 [Trichonephila clavipes]